MAQYDLAKHYFQGNLVGKNVAELGGYGKRLTRDWQ